MVTVVTRSHPVLQAWAMSCFQWAKSPLFSCEVLKVSPPSLWGHVPSVTVTKGSVLVVEFRPKPGGSKVAAN